MRAVPDRPLLKELASRDVRRPVYSITRRDDVLHFQDGVTLPLSGAFPGVASTVRVKADHPVTVWLSMHEAGHTYLVNAPYLVNAMNGVSATNHLIDVEWASLKADITDTEYVIGAATWDGHVSVDRYSLTDFTLASTIAVSQLQCSADATMVKRMEAVCDLDGTNCLLVFGIHDITNLLSTLQFWKIGPANSHQLETVVQIPMGTAATFNAPDWTEYDTGAQYCANVYVINNGNGYTIVCNNLATGRAVQFRWNGIESQLTQIIQIDVDASTVTFTPTGLIKIADLYYLSGLFTRPMTDGTTDFYCVYLTSSDAWNWSVGERSFLVSGDATKGGLAYLPGMTNIVYVGLNATGIKTYFAPARVIDGVGTAEDITDGMVHWSIDEATDSADAMSLDMLAGTPITEGDHVTFYAGWTKDDGSAYPVLMGDFVADQVPSIVTDAGPQVTNISLLDRAGRIANDWKASVDVAQYSRTNHEDALNALDKMVVKSVIRDAKIKSQSDPENVAKAVIITDGALYSDSLNDPFVGYSTERDDRDGIWYAEVEFAATDDGCQQSFGFVFGGSATQFNAVLIPKVSDWEGHRFDDSGPILVTSDLQPKDATTGIGEWNTPSRVTSLIKSVLIDVAGSTMTKSVGTANASAYRPSGAWAFQAGHKYQVALRKAGSRLQTFVKIMDYAPANCIANADWLMIAEFKLDETVRHAWDDRPYSGMALSTDVWMSTQAFAEAEYGDIDTALTGATPYEWVNLESIGSCSLYLDIPHQGGREGQTDLEGNNDHLKLSTAGGTITEWPPEFVLGAPLRLHGTVTGIWTNVLITDLSNFPNFIVSPHLYAVWWWYGEYNNGQGTYTTKGYHAGEGITIYSPGLMQDWGYATSGYETQRQSIYGADVLTITDGSVVKRSGQSKGKAFTINDGSDSTAEFTRFARSDGSKHVYMSGNAGGNVFDETNPCAVPRVWSFKMNPSVFMDYASTDVGLPETGYFKDEDEFIRYGNESFPWLGTLDGEHVYNHWCMCPTYYFVLKAAIAGTDGVRNLMQWMSPGWEPQVSTTGMFDISNVKGLLAEIRARTNATNITNDSSAKYYVDSTTANNESGYISYANNHFVTLDKPYPNDIAEPGSGNAADVLIVSGRAQLGSDKGLHDASAPVVFYPMPLTDPPALLPFPWLIRVDSFDQYQGLYNSIEDDLRYTNALAGVRETHFRSLGSFSGNLTDSPVTLHTNLSNFVLDIKAHLFGINDNRLRITFRGGQYILDLQHLITDDDLISGRMGNIRYLLQAPLSNIVKGANEAKWLDQNTIAVSGSDISGTYVDGVHTDDPYVQSAIRLVVRDNKIIIEVEGQQVWTINLDHCSYVDTATPPVTHSYKFLDYGAVTIQYTGSVDVPVTARLLELSAEIEAHIIDMNSTLGDAVGFLLEGRHIWSRSHEDGGTLFTTNLVRENWSSDAVDLIENIQQDQQIDTGMEVAGHVITSGAEFGEYMDAEWIRLYGYTFEMGQNRLLNTVQDSRDEARIILRTAKEHARQRQFSGPGLLDLQPLDRLTVSRPASGDISATTTAGYIVKSKHTEGDINSITGELDTFLEQAI